MKTKMTAIAVAAALLGFGNVTLAQTKADTKKGQADVATSPNQKASMARLQEAAQKLREAVQAMATQPAGPGRNKAMDQTRQALYDTQTAMLRLPPELRTAGK